MRFKFAKKIKKKKQTPSPLGLRRQTNFLNSASSKKLGNSASAESKLCLLSTSVKVLSFRNYRHA